MLSSSSPALGKTQGHRAAPQWDIQDTGSFLVFRCKSVSFRARNLDAPLAHLSPLAGAFQTSISQGPQRLMAVTESIGSVVTFTWETREQIKSNRFLNFFFLFLFLCFVVFCFLFCFVGFLFFSFSRTFYVLLYIKTPGGGPATLLET